MTVAEVVLGSTVYSVIGLRYAQVMQGCLLSPLLFAIVTDWRMKHATEEAGLKLTKDKRLTDLCYADDVSLIDGVLCPAPRVGGIK